MKRHWILALLMLLGVMGCSVARAGEIDLRRWEPMSQGGYSYPVYQPVYQRPCRASGQWIPHYLYRETIDSCGGIYVSRERLPDVWLPNYDDSWRWQQNTGYAQYR